jgi:hypothetical protein
MIYFIQLKENIDQLNSKIIRTIQLDYDINQKEKNFEILSVWLALSFV